ncbi:energy transducer TonB [Paraburkholderia adhaesiva]|uniref:energy transducer TonB n=1 Tax=Paraburkholderia adhaesiva TaxID=2883244 RepID=UPI001F1D296C|nr:energy transducer TonB [Paraburkholderia adhaesiva]
MGAALLVGGLHAAVLGFVMSRPEPRREPAPLHVVAAELIAAAPAISALPPPAAPPRPQPPAHERPTSAPHPVARSVAPPPHEPVAEPQRQATPAAAPAPTVTPAPQSDVSPAAPQASSTQHAVTGNGEQHPRAVAQLDCTIAKPAYPLLSRRSRESGTALVELRIDVTGHIDSAHVAASSGYPRLDAAALDAVQASACTPYKENGKPVPATAKVPVVFNLSE